MPTACPRFFPLRESHCQRRRSSQLCEHWSAAFYHLYYIVRAADSAGESGNSNRAHATTLANGGSNCQITYTDQNDWGSGFTGAVSIKNTGNTQINGWTLTWTWSGNQQITQSWNSIYSQSGQNVALTNATWNPIINPGDTLTGIGFNANYSGLNNNPTVFHLNGMLCQ